jgi:hypothetical protein
MSVMNTPELPTNEFATYPCDKDGVCPQHRQQGAFNATENVTGFGTGTAVTNAAANARNDDDDWIVRPKAIHV